MPRERRAGQLMDPRWRGRNWASGAATVAVLILASLCKGTGSQPLDYSLRVPASVSVQRGLCVHIPCTFTYPHQSPTYPTQLYAYWFKDKGGTKHYFNRYDKAPGQLVATNDKRQYIDSSARGRFQLTGNPAHGDCSFSVNDAKDEDREQYYFRIDGGDSFKFSYRYGYTRPRVIVTALTARPEIRKSSKMISGEPVTITCQAPGTCSGTPPEISWTPYGIGSSPVPWQQSHSNGSVTYRSNITITPTQYEGQDLTCSVRYPGGNWPPVANTIRVGTACAPRMHLSTVTTPSEKRSSSLQKPFRNPVSVTVQEGDTLSLHCEADSIPDPLLSWTKGNKTLNNSKQARGHNLQLSEIRSEDAGLYRCQATNLIGSAEKTVWVDVQYAPTLVGEATSTCWRENNDLLCTCALHSWPAPQIWWQVGGETLSGNSNREALSVSSWLQGKKAISNLRLTRNLEGKHSIICLGNNSVGVFTKQFPLNTFTTGFHIGILSKLFGSETNGIIFLLGLYLFKAVLCFLLFFTFQFLNQRKSPLRKASLTTTSGL